MNKKAISIFYVLSVMFAVFLFYKPVLAEGYCYCINKQTRQAVCVPPDPSGVCVDSPDYNACTAELNSQIPPQPDPTACDAKMRSTNAEGTPNTGGQGSTSNNYGGWKGLIPQCTTQETLGPDCRDITIFLVLMFHIIDYLFGIIGGVALLFFVYGGFVFILSQGNAEKVEHGKGIIVAAVLGLIIAFGGYALVAVVGEMVGISDQFKIDKQ